MYCKFYGLTNRHHSRGRDWNDQKIHIQKFTSGPSASVTLATKEETSRGVAMRVF